MSRALAVAGMAAPIILSSIGLMGCPRTGQSPAPPVHDPVLATLQAVTWGMTAQGVRDRLADKAFVPAVAHHGRDGVAFITGYQDRIEGHSVFVGFHFAQPDRLVRVAWSFDVGHGADPAEIQRLYAATTERYRRQFGTPLIEAEGGVTTARWRTPHGIVIVGTTGSGDSASFAMQGWDERHFLAAAGRSTR